MTARIERTSNSLSLRDQLFTDFKHQYGVPVELFLEYYNVRSPEVEASLRDHPTLCYLLGNVTAESQGVDNRPDGVMRPVYFLTEGSAMFGLEKKEDAMRWRGIFNHNRWDSQTSLLFSHKIKRFITKTKRTICRIGIRYIFIRRN